MTVPSFQIMFDTLVKLLGCVILFVSLTSGQSGNECDHDALLVDTPHIVYITVSNITFCTGTSLNRQWSVTSAHCVLRSSDGRTPEEIAADSFVVLSAKELDGYRRKGKPSGHKHLVEAFLPHPDFNMNEKDKPYKKDIALVKLKVPFELEVEEILHPLRYFNHLTEPEKMTCFLVGYGLHFYGGQPSSLFCSRLSVFTFDECKEIASAFPWDNGETICAQTKLNVDKEHHCVWSSGGPLMCDGGDGLKLAGVVTAYAGPAKEHVRSDWMCSNTTKEVIAITPIGEVYDWIQSNINTLKEDKQLDQVKEPEEEPKRGKVLTCGLVTHLGDFPYVALIHVSYHGRVEATGGIVCTGTLLSSQWVVTAAHCLWPPAIRKGLSAVAATSMYVQVGFTHRDREKPLQVRTGLIYDLHPQFVTNPTDKQRKQPYSYDIGLLKVNKPFVFDDNVHSIRVMGKNFTINDTKCMTVGYGLRLSGKESVLHCASVRAHLHTECRSKYSKFPWTDEYICADSSKTRQCFRDSGGPLICADHKPKVRLVGLMNVNPKAEGEEVRSDTLCSTGNYTLVAFTHTSHHFDWIESVTHVRKKSLRKPTENDITTDEPKKSESIRLKNFLGKEMYVIMFCIKLAHTVLLKV